MTNDLVEVDDGAVLHTATQGQGRPLVLCHGGPGGIDALDPLAAMITDLAQVHRYDQRACGRSSGRRPFTMARWIADLEGLREHWGLRRWIVGGQSFGAGLALAYALEHPDRTEAVLYLSCIVRLQGQPDWDATFRQARAEHVPAGQRRRYQELRRQREQDGHLPEPLVTELRRLGVAAEFGDQEVANRLLPQLQAELAAINEDVNRELGVDFVRYFAAASLRSRLQALDLPVLLVHGEVDPRPVAAAQALAEALPRARLVTMPGVGHFPFLESPTALKLVIRRFLRSLP
jgi:proline iminopeptidase